MANVPFNPYAITNVQDSFSVQSQGYWQGDVLDDPATRFQISAGVIKSTETLPMWGGLAVTESTPPATAVNTGQASVIARATAATVSGFSTFKGSNSAVITPSSQVPMSTAGGSFNFVRLGSNSRVVVPCSAAVLALAGSNNPQFFTWDATNLQVIPGDGTNQFRATLIQVQSGNSATVVYDGVAGTSSWNLSGNVAVILI